MGDKADDSEPNYSTKVQRSRCAAPIPSTKRVIRFVFTKSPQSPAMQQVIKILFWKDVKQSGIAFGLGMVWFYMTMWGGYTVMSFASVLLILHLVVSIIKNSALRSQTPDAAPQIDVEAIKKAAESAVNELNRFLTWYWTLLGAANLMAALQVVGVLLITWTVGSWFQFYTICFLAFMTSFSVPVAYHANKKICDEKIDMVMKHVQTGVEMVKAKIPVAIKSEDGKKTK